MTLASVPLPESDEGFTDPEFDHIEEAKDALQDVVASGRLDFSAAIAVAQTHALISIAQSLEVLAFAGELEEDEYEISVINVGEFVHHPDPVIGVTGHNIDYYREG